MTNPHDLLAAFPDCRHAVAWVELMMCTPMEPGEPSMMDQIMDDLNPLSPADLLPAFRAALLDEIHLGTQGRWADCLVQIDHPSFMVYLRGKMGAV